MAEKEKSKIVERLEELATPEGVQKYLFGFKKNGQPRAVYDIVKDYTKPKKGKKNKKKDKDGKSDSTFSFYLNTKKGKKKKKKNKYWHI